MSSAEKPLKALVFANKGTSILVVVSKDRLGRRKSSVVMVIVAADRAPRAPGDAQDDEGDGEADEGVGDGAPSATTAAEATTPSET